MSFVLFLKLGHCPGKPMEVPDRRDEPLTEVHTPLSSVVTIPPTGQKMLIRLHKDNHFGSLTK